MTSVARHHELGPVALAVLKRSAPEDVELVVDCDGGDVAAAQEVVVPGEGVSVDRPPRAVRWLTASRPGAGAPQSMI
ncbi:hypothetical protein NKG05_17560 [Oerskovia sp. M15]